MITSRKVMEINNDTRVFLTNLIYDAGMIGYILCWFAPLGYIVVLTLIGLADNSFPPGSYESIPIDAIK